MAGFRRVYRQFPGYAEIGNIESTNVLEITPPAAVQGAGTGVVLLVGEFERGPLVTPTEVFGPSDLLDRFGGLGHQLPTNPHAGPVAVRSGGDELWNGNGFLWLRNKRFSGLVISRVDNSAGSVEFSRLASLLGDEGPYTGVGNGGTVIFQRDGAGSVTVTFTGTQGQITGDGFPGDASQAWQVDVSGAPDFVDVTTDLNDVGAADIEPFPATEAVGDYFAVGRAHTTFSQIIFDYAGGTAGVGGVVVWEYWDGSAWTALTGVTDNTTGFTAAAADGLTVSWTVPSDWAQLVLNGVQAYYVRARITTVYTTDPVLDQAYVQADNVTNFVGGETLELRTRRNGPVRVVTFTSADQTLANVVSRINAVLAQTIASTSGTQLVLSSEISGSDGYIEIVGGTARATLGLPLGTTAQVHTFTVTNVTAGDYEIPFTLNVNGVLTTYTIEATAAGGESVGDFRTTLATAAGELGAPGITVSTDGAADFLLSADANVSFTVGSITEPAPGDITSDATTPVVVTAAGGLGNVPNVDLIEASDAVTVFDAASGLGADLNPDQLLRVTNDGTPGTGTLQVTGGTRYTNFGFDLTTVADADEAESVVIPAGTRVQDSTDTATIWVTIEDVTTGTGGGAFSARVRPWTDTDTAIASSAGDVTLVLDTLDDSFSVTNALTITRLSGAQLDTRYLEALKATLDENTAGVKANIVASARASTAIGRALKANAIEATATGLAARKAIVRPLLGYTRDQARANTEMGVGNIGRDERVFYVFPGATMYVPEIASLGPTIGGLGFTADGVIEVGADSFYASIRSILPPEENAGQRLTDTNAGDLQVVALEDDYNPELGGISLKIADYQSFKANGIIALRRDRTVGWVFQSDVTSVDPLVDPAKVEASRMFLGDLVIDTTQSIGVKYIKKLGTPGRKQAMLSELRSFLRGLESPNDPESSRIAGYLVTETTTTELSEQGFMVVDIGVRTYPHLKHLLFRTQVGTTVQTTLA